MTWISAALAAYGVLGVALVRRLGTPTLKINAIDQMTGAMAMPVIALLSAFCAVLRASWKWILVLLDFNPEE